MSSQCLVSGRNPAMAITTVVLAIEVKIKVKRFCFIFCYIEVLVQRKLGWVGSEIFKSQGNLCYFFTAKIYIPLPPEVGFRMRILKKPKQENKSQK